MSKIKALQLFNHYLPISENWAFHLLSNVPEVDHHIGANLLLENQFKSQQFKYVYNYLEKPMEEYRNLDNASLINLIKKVKIKALPFFKGSTNKHFSNYVLEHNIDLIHAHFANVAWQFLPIAKTTGRPFIVSFYGWDYESLEVQKPEYKERIKELFHLADAVLCEGSYGANTLLAKACPRNKIHVQKLGVQIEKITFHKRQKERSKLKLVQLASFVEKKGHIYTLKAFQKALEQCPEMTLDLFGIDQGMGIIETMVEFITRHQLHDKVRIHGSVAFEDLHSLFADYHVFIQPSCVATNKDCEGGAPIALLDAQATGLPVIATRHCDIPSYVHEGVSGLLAEERDVETLSAHIRKFYEMDQNDYNKNSQAARKHVEKDYSIAENAKNLHEIYQSVLKKK